MSRIVTCQPEIVGSEESWGIWCDWCQWGVAGLDSRRTADQAGQAHRRQRLEDRRKVMER